MKKHRFSSIDNTAFKQQHLPAFWIYYSAKRILCYFFAIGIFCITMGIILLSASNSITEIEINYTKNCANCATFRENANNFKDECSCSIPFYLPQAIQGKVYMYYKLYGFYQNLYQYVKSRSNNQLLGMDIKNVDGCTPFTYSNDGLPYAPCGAIANSMFNDTIILSYNLNSSTHVQVPMLRSGIAWWTDKYVMFQNPPLSNLTAAFNGTAKPPSWHRPIYQMDEEMPENNGFLNEDFIVWMRIAAFPTFKKLYRLLNRTGYFSEGLPPDFPVTMFDGEKSVILTNLTWSGGKSTFLGIAYMVTGAITWLVTFCIIGIHLRNRRKKPLLSDQ